MTPDLTAETVEQVLGAARRAPSIHNTQPWRFVVAGDGLDLFADRDRQLPVLDPDGRQLHLSCGAAVQHAQVAARALGLDADVQLLPDPANPDHLARIVLHRGAAPSADERALAAAVEQRHTDRNPFAPGHMDAETLDRLRRAVTGEGAGLRCVNETDDRVELTVLLWRADEEEARDPAYQAELAAWTGVEGHPDDGIPRAVLDPRAGEGSSLAMRRFPQDEDLPPRGDGSQDPPPAEHPDVLLVTTEQDGPADWLLAGRALGALLLRATVEGLAASPLGQATDRAAYRFRLGRALSLVGVPQMVLRVGHPGPGHPAEAAMSGTGRRPVSEIVQHADPD